MNVKQDELLSALVHDLRDPLAAVRTATHLLGAPALDVTARARLIGIIDRQISRMSLLLDGLSGAGSSKPELPALEQEPISVHAPGENAVEVVRRLVVAGVQTVERSSVRSEGLSRRALTVLVADDNRDAADMIGELLRLNGHLVRTTNDGVQAVVLADQWQPDVLVVDIGMPGLNGYEVARHVRRTSWGAHVLLVAATGWDQDEDRQTALAAGFDVYLTKPIGPKKLTSLIAERANQIADDRTHRQPVLAELSTAMGASGQ